MISQPCSSLPDTDRAIPAQDVRILHVVGAVGRRSYGVGAIVRALVKSQRELGPDVAIWSNDDPAEAAEIRQIEDLGPQSLVTFPVIGPLRYSYSPALERAAASEAAGEFSLLHAHTVWPLCTRAAMHWRAKFQRPTLISLHGELDPVMLKQRSPLKKSLMSRLYVRKNLTLASCIHAGGPNEVAAIRDFGLRNSIAVIPNGVSPDWLDTEGNAARFRERYSLPADKRILLYMSRVTPKKGIPLLLEAISQSPRAMDDWLLLIAGPDEFGHVKELRALAGQLGVEQHLRFIGPVFEQDRRDALEAAEVFVLPTHGEGNPMAVVEAAGVGLPVLTTQAAPCEYLAQHDCGWWTKVEVSAIRDALQDALQSSKARLVEMGARGIEHVRCHLLWPTIAEQTVQLYQWLLGRSGRPDFVIED